MKKIILSLVTAFIFLFAFSGKISAEESMKANLNSNDQNQLLVNLQNVGEGEITDISYQIKLPEHLQIDGELPEIKSLKFGESKDLKLNVKKVSQAIPSQMSNQATSLWQKILPSTGEKVVLYTVAGLVLLFFTIILWKYSKARKLLILLTLLSGSIWGASKALATSTVKNLEVKKVLKLYQEDAEVTLLISYRTNLDTEKLGEVSSELSASSASSSTSISSLDSLVPKTSISSGDKSTGRNSETSITEKQSGKTNETDSKLPTQPSMSDNGDKEILISGYAINSLGTALEEEKITLSKENKIVEETTTEVDGYFYIHAVRGQTYTLYGQDFEVTITANGNNDIQVENKLGSFSLGKQILDANGKTVLLPSVVQFDDVVDYQVDESAAKVVLTTEEKLNAGDIFVLPPNGTYPTGFAYKVISSKVENGQTILHVAPATLEEVAREIQYEGTLGVEEAAFIPAEGIKVSQTPIEENSLDRDVSVSVSKSYDFEKGNLSGKATITGSIKIKFDWLAYLTDKSIKTEVIPAINVLVDSEFKAEKSISDEFKLGTYTFTAPNGITVPVDIYIYYNASGEVEVNAKSDFNISATFGIDNSEAYFENNISLQNNLDVLMKGNIEVGPKAVFKPGYLNISVVDLDASVGLGLDGELEAAFSQQNLEKPKLDSAKGKLDFYGDVSLGYNIHILTFKKAGKFIENKRLFTHELGSFDTDKTSESSNATSKDIEESQSESADKTYSAVYKSVFDDYSSILGFSKATKGNISNDIQGYQRLIKNLHQPINDWVVEGIVQSQGEMLRYALYDVNKDGVDELLVGNEYKGNIYLSGVYYLNNSTPKLLAQGVVAGHGGYRESMILFKDGSIISYYWYSGTGDGKGTLYILPKYNLESIKISEQSIRVPGTNLQQAFGKIDTPELELYSIKWQKFAFPNT